MTAMLENYNASHVNCEDVEAEAKISHSACERQHGICDVSMLLANQERFKAIYFENFRYNLFSVDTFTFCGYFTNQNTAKDFRAGDTCHNKRIKMHLMYRCRSEFKYH